VLSPERCKPLLLGVRVDVCADDEADDIEEGDPGRLWQELLGERERDGRNDPADLHDGPEACFDGGANLVEGACAGDEGHGDEVYAVLDGGDLGRWLLHVLGLERSASELTRRLLTRICRIFALRLLRPWKTFCSRLMRTWPRGALTSAPYNAILGTREVK
jgi:hypothetical protein